MPDSQLDTQGDTQEDIGRFLVNIWSAWTFAAKADARQAASIMTDRRIYSTMIRASGWPV